MEVGPDREAGRAKEVSYLRVGEPSHLRCPQRVSPDWFLCFCDLPPSSYFILHFSLYRFTAHSTVWSKDTFHGNVCCAPW